MKYFSLFTITFFLSFFVANSQERYLEEIVDTVDVGTYTYVVKDGEQLNMDIYQPMYDAEFERPVIMYVHGGGFEGGARDEPNIQEFCKRMARRGYVVASVSYRLTRKGTDTGFGCDCPANAKMATYDKVVADLQDATYFLIEQREMLGIDPQKIILSGSDAGAEAVLNTAYTSPTCYDLESGPVAYAGVIAMAGAIPDLNRIYDESAIPSMFFHGTCDDLVPYGTAPHHYCKEDDVGFLVLNGSSAIAEKLQSLDTPYWLYTVCGGDHSVAVSPMIDYFEEIMQFCFDYAINGENNQIHTVVSGAQECDLETSNYCNE